MFTVYNYLLEPRKVISMPKYAKILTVQVKDNKPYIWVLVDTELECVDYNFTIVSTGHNAEDCVGKSYIGTYQLYEGNLVFHVFL